MQTEKTSTSLIGVHAQRENIPIQAHDDMDYTVATQDYVKKVVQYFQDKFNCLFVIATNNRTSAESVFSKLVNIQYVSTGIGSPSISMSIISSFDQVIRTTRTFSWWIGYLFKETILYCKKIPERRIMD